MALHFLPTSQSQGVSLQHFSAHQLKNHTPFEPSRTEALIDLGRYSTSTTRVSILFNHPEFPSGPSRRSLQPKYPPTANVQQPDRRYMSSDEQFGKIMVLGFNVRYPVFLFPMTCTSMRVEPWSACPQKVEFSRLRRCGSAAERPSRKLSKKIR